MAAQSQEKQTQSKPILKRMNVNFCVIGYYDSRRIGSFFQADHADFSVCRDAETI